MELNPLILASGSPFRRAMLTSAGVQVDVIVPEIDETFHKAEFEKRFPKPPADEISLHLAGLKAEDVSSKNRGRLVIGSDQVLTFEGEIFSKPASIDDARGHLIRLRGKAHELVTAVVLAVDGVRVWSHIASANLVMRPFSDRFLDSYLARQGDRVLSTVGAYEVEGFGSQLFDRIEGDHFTIVGLPLLPLLSELRRRGHLPE